MSTPTTGEPIALNTLNERNQPPKSRLSSASQAQEIFWRLDEAQVPRLQKAAVMQGMFDGNPPYNTSKMRNHAQGWRANFNTLEGVSRLESAKTPFNDLLSTTDLYADCYTPKSSGAVDAATASRIRSEQFTKMLRGWPQFEPTFWTMFTDFVAFNRGFLWFPKEDSWHFKRIPWYRVMFPDGTGCDPDEWEMFAIKHQWPVHKLWDFVKDAENAKYLGWNVEQVYKAIRQAMPKPLADKFQDPMELQKAFKSGDLYTSMGASVVLAASIYVREFDGSWSRMMVQADYGNKGHSSGREMSPVEAQKMQQEATAEGSKLKEGEWLFQKHKVGEYLHQIICPFIFEVGDGSINSIEGLGKRIVSIMQLKDRLVNSVADNAMMASNLLLAAPNGGTQLKGSAITVNPGVTMIAPGWTPQPGTMFGNIDGPLAVSQQLDRMVDVNTGIFRPTIDKPSGNPVSATEASQRFAQSTVLSNSAVMRFYTQLDPFYAEIYRRAAKDFAKNEGKKDKGIKSAQDFQKRCKDAGLSDEQVRDLEPGCIRAQRAIGNGSQSMRQQVAGSLGQVMPFLGPRGLESWKRLFVAAFGGQQAVEQLLPAEDTAQRPTQDDWDATSENADAQTGAPILFMAEQNHETHAKHHLAAAVGAIQSVQQGADPAGAFTFLQVIVPHVAQHIARVARPNVKREMESAFQQVVAAQKQVEQAAEQKIQQQQQAQEMSFDQQMKMQETQAKLQMSAAKTQQQLETKGAKFQQDAALADARVANEIQLSQARTQAEIENAKLKAQQAAQKPKATEK